MVLHNRRACLLLTPAAEPQLKACSLRGPLIPQAALKSMLPWRASGLRCWQTPNSHRLNTRACVMLGMQSWRLEGTVANGAGVESCCQAFSPWEGGPWKAP